MEIQISTIFYEVKLGNHFWKKNQSKNLSHIMSFCSKFHFNLSKAQVNVMGSQDPSASPTSASTPPPDFYASCRTPHSMLPHHRQPVIHSFSLEQWLPCHLLQVAAQKSSSTEASPDLPYLKLPTPTPTLASLAPCLAISPPHIPPILFV